MATRPSKRRQNIEDALDHFAHLGLIANWLQGDEATVFVWSADGSEHQLKGLAALELFCSALASAEAATRQRHPHPPGWRDGEGQITVSLDGLIWVTCARCGELELHKKISHRGISVEVPADTAARSEPSRPDPANLVIVSDIAYRVNVAVSTVATWPERYGDWPEPLVLGAQQRPGSHGRQAVYWWPEILAFLARHDLAGGHPGRKNSTADDALADHDGPPHRHDSDGRPSY